MVNSGLLKFSDDQKVRVDLNAETGEVIKAVTIDADGVETPIGGGGGDSSFKTVNVTLENSADSQGPFISFFAALIGQDSAGDTATSGSSGVNKGQTRTVQVVMHDNLAILRVDDNTAEITTEGSAEVIPDTGKVKITGDCTLHILQSPK